MREFLNVCCSGFRQRERHRFQIVAKFPLPIIAAYRECDTAFIYIAIQDCSGTPLSNSTDSSRASTVSAIMLQAVETIVLLIAISFFPTLFPNAQALPSGTLDQQLPALSNTSLNEVIPHCFNQVSHPGIGFTNAADCNRALEGLIRQPGFTTLYRFSKNPRRADVIKVPKGWGAGACVIFVSCSNTRDSDVFRYADVAYEARKVIKKCISDEIEEPYGGLNEVGLYGTFYVSVGRPVAPRARQPILEGTASVGNVSTS